MLHVEPGDTHLCTFRRAFFLRQATTTETLRLARLTRGPCAGNRLTSPPCPNYPHEAGTAFFVIAEDVREDWWLDTTWHHGDGGLEVESVGGIQTLFGGNLPLTDRVYGAIWDVIREDMTT